MINFFLPYTTVLLGESHHDGGANKVWRLLETAPICIIGTTRE